MENWQGRAKLKAKVTPVVPRWMVMAAHGWWFPERDGEVGGGVLRREEPVLIQILRHGQLVAGAEQRFHVPVGQVNVPRGDAYHKVRLARRAADLRQDDLAHDLFNKLPIDSR